MAEKDAIEFIGYVSAIVVFTLCCDFAATRQLRVARGSKFWDPTRPDPVKA